MKLILNQILFVRDDKIRQGYMGRTSSMHGSCKELVEYLVERGEEKRSFERGLINCRKRSNAMFNHTSQKYHLRG
jgi:hypothetical protein